MDRDLHVVFVGYARAQQSIAAGVVPQSSWSLSPIAPASICSASGAGRDGVALAEKAEVHRQAIGRLEHPVIFHGPGVQVVALVPVAGPVPPPISVVSPRTARRQTSCGQMKCTWASIPPAVTIMFSPAMLPSGRPPSCRA